MPTPWHVANTQFRIRKFCVGPLENNVYVIACSDSEAALIIDAADEPDRIVAEVADVDPVAIITTHGHWDHVGAAHAVRDRLGIPFRIAASDAELAGIAPDQPIVDGEELLFGSMALQALATPGHTPGSTCFAVDGVVFTGDTLFPGGPGATSGPEAFGQIIDSVTSTLFSMASDTLVLPGHGLDTTIGTESPSLSDWVARGY